MGGIKHVRVRFIPGGVGNLGNHRGQLVRSVETEVERHGIEDKPEVSQIGQNKDTIGAFHAPLFDQVRNMTLETSSRRAKVVSAAEPSETGTTAPKPSCSQITIHLIQIQTD